MANLPTLTPRGSGGATATLPDFDALYTGHDGLVRRVLADHAVAAGYRIINGKLAEFWEFVDDQAAFDAAWRK